MQLTKGPFYLRIKIRRLAMLKLNKSWWDALGQAAVTVAGMVLTCTVAALILLRMLFVPEVGMPTFTLFIVSLALWVYLSALLTLGVSVDGETQLRRVASDFKPLSAFWILFVWLPKVIRGRATFLFGM